MAIITAGVLFTVNYEPFHNFTNKGSNIDGADLDLIVDILVDSLSLGEQHRSDLMKLVAVFSDQCELDVLCDSLANDDYVLEKYGPS